MILVVVYCFDKVEHLVSLKVLVNCTVCNKLEQKMRRIGIVLLMLMMYDDDVSVPVSLIPDLSQSLG
jgi:hypothetical protein